MDWLIFFGLLVKHFFGDMVFQSSSMSRAKRTSRLAILEHCLVHAALTLVLLTMLFKPLEYFGLVLAGIDGVSHFWIDWFKIKLENKYPNRPESLFQSIWFPRNSETIILLDQSLHATNYVIIVMILVGKGLI